MQIRSRAGLLVAREGRTRSGHNANRRLPELSWAMIPKRAPSGGSRNAYTAVGMDDIGMHLLHPRAFDYFVRKGSDPSIRRS